jgi:hypothetical protein
MSKFHLKIFSSVNPQRSFWHLILIQISPPITCADLNEWGPHSWCPVRSVVLGGPSSQRGVKVSWSANFAIKGTCDEMKMSSGQFTWKYFPQLTLKTLLLAFDFIQIFAAYHLRRPEWRPHSWCPVSSVALGSPSQQRSVKVLISQFRFQRYLRWNENVRSIHLKIFS